MSKIFGRKKIVKQIWKILEKESILFVAERRIGKTTVLDQLRDNPHDDYIVIFSDVEGITTPLEFVKKIIQSLSSHLNPKEKIVIEGWETIKELLGSMETNKIKFPRLKKNWKPLLEKALTIICAKSDKKVVFLWDEIPYMLQKIHQHEQKSAIVENNSLEILDILRSLRKNNNNLRMIFTGSIGLHHILTEISHGISTEPLNDMKTVPLTPLTPSEAKEMVMYLLDEEDVIEIDDNSIDLIIKQCDRVPFYIKRMIERLGLQEHPINSVSIRQTLNEMIVDANDELEMEHFRSRLTDYYTGSETLENDSALAHSDIAKQLLDIFAATETSLSIDECYQLIKTYFPINRDLLIKLLNDLANDYYLCRNTDGSYYFCFTLLKQWWLKAQGLTGEEQ